MIGQRNDRLPLNQRQNEIVIARRNHGFGLADLAQQYFDGRGGLDNQERRGGRYAPILQDADELLDCRGVVPNIADEQSDAVTVPLEPRYEVRHRIQVRPGLRRRRRSVILDSEPDDSSPAYAGNAGSDGARREAEHRIGANAIALRAKTDPLQILLRRFVAVAAVGSKRKAPFQHQTAERMVDRPNAHA